VSPAPSPAPVPQVAKIRLWADKDIFVDDTEENRVRRDFILEHQSKPVLHSAGVSGQMSDAEVDDWVENWSAKGWLEPDEIVQFDYDRRHCVESLKWPDQPLGEFGELLSTAFSEFRSRKASSSTPRSPPASPCGHRRCIPHDDLPLKEDGDLKFYIRTSCPMLEKLPREHFFKPQHAGNRTDYLQYRLVARPCYPESLVKLVHSYDHFFGVDANKHLSIATSTWSCNCK
jgi:hypothetical protein